MAEFDDLLDSIAARRVLLWIVSEGAGADSDSSPISQLAEIYWEAVWTESPGDRFYSSSKDLAAKSRSPDAAITGLVPRQPYQISAEPDEPGQIDRSRFLPIYQINGAGDVGHEAASSPLRSLHRLGQMQKLSEFPSRSLLVVGANEASELQSLSEALYFAPPGLKVFVIWPQTIPVPDAGFSHIGGTRVAFIRESLANVVARIRESGPPAATVASALGLRYGRADVVFDERIFERIREQFAVITTMDLSADSKPTGVLSLFRELGSLGQWRPYAAGIPFDRSYRPETGSEEGLSGFLISRLRSIEREDASRNLTIHVPATAGSGITTALRMAAFRAAESGFPVLVCRPQIRDVSMDRLTDFLSKIRQAAPNSNEHPALIMFDREHYGVAIASRLAAGLATRGRKAIVIRVLPPTIPTLADSDDSTTTTGARETLPVFRGGIAEAEIERFAAHIDSLFALDGIPSPSLEDWKRFEASNRVTGQVGGVDVESLFWTVLHLFLPRPVNIEVASQWIIRVCDQEIDDPDIKRVIQMLAAFSTFGLATPLGMVLRSSGGAYSEDLPTWKTLIHLSNEEEVLNWHSTESSISDQSIGFRHRVIAAELFKALGEPNWNDPLERCEEGLSWLVPTQPADAQLLEDFVFSALRPPRTSMSLGPAKLRRMLSTYEAIPAVLSERSAATQHHWARTLMQLARLPETQDPERLLRGAMAKLEIAAELAKDRDQGEHPRNIYNTLGTVRAEISRRHRNSDPESSLRLWKSAASAFELALGFGADNLVVLSAYAHRLIEHSKELFNDMPDESIEEVASAITYLNQALSLPEASEDDSEYLNSLLVDAYRLLDNDRALSHLNSLRETEPAVWATIQAQLILRQVPVAEWDKGQSEVTAAFNVLEEVSRMHPSAGGWRFLYLLYKLGSAAKETRFNFQFRLQALDRLEGTPFHWDARLRFAQAVLCYQVGDYIRGFRSFQNLRRDLNNGTIASRHLVSFWRNAKEPSQARATAVRLVYVDTDWRAYGVVADLASQRVLVRPRWFAEPPEPGEVRDCFVFFEPFGPVAVPTDRPPRSVID